MEFNPDELDQKAIYKLISGAVIPRPIGWISTISEDGINNLAPFSFFNVVGDDPPHVMFATAHSNQQKKDTLANTLATGEFVVNLVTEDIVEAMNTTAQTVHADIDEFELAGLTPVPSVKVSPPRVKESPVSFECRLVHHYFLEGHKYGGATVVIGRVVMFHFDEKVLLDDYKINMENYKPVARLAGSNYSKLGEIFAIKRQ
ncbi:MAG: flavin reductase family protein [Flavobacterium lindanitolerans]|jgi:flavin reductase (DIM6/NTAB) family NADH-FMN oxidoreductase RutF|uniref:flavin reductase family protein n=1 Tax=Flavobacterium lindanitolerans TaxID=428988 RepID=UPI001A63C0ED|nr:flavin reductase family protein [Flavobacterium lindanitolerans]MBL7867273.1 flavin reductase family protein [Flavobacterium lindanitolerans]